VHVSSVIIFYIIAQRSNDSFIHRLPILSARKSNTNEIEERVGKVFILQLCLFMSYSFCTFSSQKGKYFLKIQVENHKELDHRTQVNKYDNLGCVTKNICHALLSFQKNYSCIFLALFGLFSLPN
jgi:hypothetical protein